MNDKTDQKDHGSTVVLYLADDASPDYPLKRKTIHSRVKKEDKFKYEDKNI